MKNRGGILTLALLLLAALAGWFLPAAFARSEDARLEASPVALQLPRVDLSYQTNLSLPEKLRMFRDRPLVSSMRMEAGVYLEADDIPGILEPLLAQVLKREVTLYQTEIHPVLVATEEGESLLLWTGFANLDGGVAEYAVDDQTGALLGLNLYDVALPRAEGNQLEQYLTLLSRLGAALEAHYAERGEDLRLQEDGAAVVDWQLPYLADGRLVFADGSEELDLPVMVRCEDDVLEFNVRT